MKKYKPYLTRVDLVKNQVERERIQEQEAAKKRKQRIQEQNRQRHLRYQEQLRSELAARYFHAVQSTGGESFSNTKSLSFDGIDDFVSVTNSNILDGLQKATWSFWFKKSGTGAKYLSGHYNNGNQFLFLFIPSSNRIDGYVNGVRPFNSNSTTISVDTWYNAVFVLDSTLSTVGDRLKLFINGTQIVNTGGAILPQNATLNSDSGDILIGKDTTGFNWDGNIDEVSFWNDAKDISDIWDGGGIPTDLTGKSNLLAWWRFEGTGATATDSGTGGNDGTINGATRDTDTPG